MFNEVQKWIEEARNLVVLSGAGISAESGVPTFRGPGGLWRNFRPEDLANRVAFARDPVTVWKWYLWRRGKIRRATPNAGHRALVKLEQRKHPHFTLVTQNVDGLHERAGSQNVARLHGSIWSRLCSDCLREENDPRVRYRALPPRCKCGGAWRPNVVWFGEPLEEAVWKRAVRAAEAADLMLVVGTSSLVFPAASLPQIVLGRGARVVEINPDTTLLTRYASASLLGMAGELLPRLVGGLD